MTAPEPSGLGDLAARRAQHEAQATALLPRALEALRAAGANAYVEVLEERGLHPPFPEVRVFVGVTVGNPTTEYTGTDVRFFAPDPAVETAPDQQRSMVLAAVKAVSPALLDEVNLGLKLADVIVGLNREAQAGDQAAVALLEALGPHLDALTDDEDASTSGHDQTAATEPKSTPRTR